MECRGHFCCCKSWLGGEQFAVLCVPHDVLSPHRPRGNKLTETSQCMGQSKSFLFISCLSQLFVMLIDSWLTQILSSFLVSNLCLKIQFECIHKVYCYGLDLK